MPSARNKLKSSIRRATRPGEPAAREEEASDAQLDIFLRHLEEDFDPTVKDAARAAGLSKKQVETAVKANSAFATALREWREKQIDAIEDGVIRAARSGDTASARFVLQNLRPERYGAKAKLDVTHRIGSFDDLKNLSDDEFEALKREIGCPQQ